MCGVVVVGHRRWDLVILPISKVVLCVRGVQTQSVPSFIIAIIEPREEIRK